MRPPLPKPVLPRGPCGKARDHHNSWSRPVVLSVDWPRENPHHCTICQSAILDQHAAPACRSGARLKLSFACPQKSGPLLINLCDVCISINCPLQNIVASPHIHRAQIRVKSKPSARALHLPTMSLPFTRQNTNLLLLQNAKSYVCGPIAGTSEPTNLFGRWIGLGFVPSRAKVGRPPPCVGALPLLLIVKSAIGYTQACKSLVYDCLTPNFNVFTSLVDAILKWRSPDKRLLCGLKLYGSIVGTPEYVPRHANHSRFNRTYTTA